MSGARAALDFFGVPDAENRVAEYAQLKQEMVVRLIEAGDFTAYPDALRLVIATTDARMLIADASSSKNAGLFLRQIRLDTFRAGARELLADPSTRLTLLDYFDAGRGVCSERGTSSWQSFDASLRSRGRPGVHP